MGNIISPHSRMEERARRGERVEEYRLCDAAMRGNIQSLNAIIVGDRYILDRVLVGSFKGKNPLHVAISTGQEGIVRQLLETKPELAKVLDPELGAALHIASAKGHMGIVRRLLEVSPGMCTIHDREGNNPLHIAAMNGNLEVLNELLQACPHAARVKVDQGDTILHLCINYNQPRCLERLLIQFGDQEFVRSTDINGNNIFHQAVFSRRLELMVLVLSKIKPKINVNATNGSGLTAMDIHSAIRDAGNSDTQIEDFLYINGARSFQALPKSPEDEPNWKKNKNHTLMVVSSLIATMAFLVGLTPPGGVFVDTLAGDKGGKAIIAYRYPNAYSSLMYVNTVGFLVSLTTILLLIIALPEEQRKVRWVRSVFSWLAIMTTAFVYTFCVFIITPNIKHERSVRIAILVTAILWAVVVSLILQVLFIRARIPEIRRSPNQSMASLILQVLLLIIKTYIRERGSPNQSMEQTQIILPRSPPDEASRSENIV